MNAYELVFIGKEKTKSPDQMKKLIKSLAGKITSQESWGKKDFAYPIKRKVSGYYFLWQLEIEKAKIPQLKKQLEWDENILRFLILKDEKAKR